jgi:hypothetical protein
MGHHQRKREDGRRAGRAANPIMAGIGGRGLWFQSERGGAAWIAFFGCVDGRIAGVDVQVDESGSNGANFEFKRDKLFEHIVMDVRLDKCLIWT